MSTGLLMIKRRWSPSSTRRSTNCFGDYLTRGGIDVPTRELLTFSMLNGLKAVDEVTASS